MALAILLDLPPYKGGRFGNENRKKTKSSRQSGANPTSKISGALITFALVAAALLLVVLRDVLPLAFLFRIIWSLTSLFT